MKTRLIITIIHTTVVVVKLSGLNGIRTHELCDTSTVLIWELVTMINNGFTCIFTIYGYITNSQRDQLPVGLTAQLVEHSVHWEQILAYLTSKVLGNIYQALFPQNYRTVWIAIDLSLESIFKSLGRKVIFYVLILCWLPKYVLSFRCVTGSHVAPWRPGALF